MITLFSHNGALFCEQLKVSRRRLTQFAMIMALFPAFFSAKADELPEITSSASNTVPSCVTPENL